MERRWAKRYRAASENRKTAILDELCALTGWPHDRARKVLRETTSMPLLESVDEVLGRAPAPEGETVFVHGDLWQGNTLWVGESFAGMVDWDSAGAGHPGVDLGSLRLDAAIHFGPAAADGILGGWREAMGREPDGVAYWDAVAALNTPADLSAFVSASRENGRPDLDAATANARRDAFLRAALDRLEHEGVTHERAG
jgi:aminoglycoside phosphotransferase (APT) family kinase protein